MAIWVYFAQLSDKVSRDDEKTSHQDATTTEVHYSKTLLYYHRKADKIKAKNMERI